ncbi:TIR domain-containing protein [Cladochytrium replicatum]|nr:TIR domain-containing protein [Cladochytrium replicatum]
MAAGGNHRDVMLSYCWKNQTRVFKLRDRLVAKGVSVWIDENDMIGDIFHAMTAAIKNSNLFVPCVSAKYATSQNAMREFTYAYNLQRSNIVPVKLENEPLGDKLDFLMGPLLYQTCFEDADCDRVAEYILKLIRDQNIQPTNDKLVLRHGGTPLTDFGCSPLQNSFPIWLRPA